MKSIDIFKAIGEIDDKFVDEAMEHKKVEKISYRRTFAMIVACLLLMVGVYAIYNIVNKKEDIVIREEKIEEKAESNDIKSDNKVDEKEDVIPEKPIEVVKRKPLHAAEYFQGMGRESFFANIPEDLIDSNPWKSDMKIDELPVYTPKFVVFNDDGSVMPPNTVRMKEKLLTVIERLGFNQDEFEISLNEENPEYIKSIIEEYKNKGKNAPYHIYGSSFYVAANDDIEISISSSMKAKISFKNMPKMDEVNLDGVESEVEKHRIVAEYLKEKYKDVMAYDKPEVAINSKGFNIDGIKRFDMDVYDGAGSDINRIVNYSLKSTYLGASLEHGLVAIHFDNFDDYEVYDNYPVIDVESAKTKLYDGDYVSSNFEKIDKSNSIISVSIVYKGLPHNPQIPFYRFVMDMNTEENGYKVYSAYYVCAIDSSFFKDGEVYKGEFNY